MKAHSARRLPKMHALGLAALLAVGVGVATPLVTAEPAEAACTPRSAVSSEYVTTPYRVDKLKVNACAAAQLSNAAGKASAATIIPGLILSWVPGAQVVGSALSGISGLAWLKQGKLQSCTSNFKTSAQITFSKGVPVSCTLIRW